MKSSTPGQKQNSNLPNTCSILSSFLFKQEAKKKKKYELNNTNWAEPVSQPSCISLSVNY